MKLCKSTVAVVLELSYNHTSADPCTQIPIYTHTKKIHTEKLLKAFKNLFLKYVPVKLL